FRTVADAGQRFAVQQVDADGARETGGTAHGDTDADRTDLCTRNGIDQQILHVELAAVDFGFQRIADGIHCRSDTDAAGATHLHSTCKATDRRIILGTDFHARGSVVQRYVVGIGADLVVDHAAGIGYTGGNAAAGAARG